MQKTAPCRGLLCPGWIVSVQLYWRGVCLKANASRRCGSCGRATVQWSRWRKRPQEFRGWVKGFAFKVL